MYGTAVERAPDYVAGQPGYLVRMTQPLRGLIPPLLDGEAVEPMVNGVRLQEFQRSANGPVLCGRPE